MYCMHCGTQLKENAKFCSNCGARIESNGAAAPCGTIAAQDGAQPTPAQDIPAAPQSVVPASQPAPAQTTYPKPSAPAPVSRGTAYVVWAILLTLLFFPLTGVVAVAYASKIRMLVDAGRYEEAGRAKKNALAWSIVTAVLGVLGGIIWLVKLLWALHVI